jgi:DNA-binding MarR family transcriptional regulator
MSTSRFDALNALLTRREASGQDWSAVEDVADNLGERMATIERLLDPCVDEGLVERRGVDQDPDYRLTRAGEMHVIENT